MRSAKIVKIESITLQADSIVEAAQVLKSGGLVIIPTETVYGIAANMANKQTLERLSKIKNRPKDKRFSLHIDRKEKIEEYAKDIPMAAYKLIDKFWPGPLTIILRARNNGTIGMRMPDNEIALRVISTAGVPVACPSANLSGEPAPKNFQEAIKDLGGLVDFAIDTGETRLQAESTVVDLTVEPPVILREGAIKKEEIENTVTKKNVLFVCTGNSCRSVMAKGYLEKRLKDIKRNNIEVLSGGIMMLEGLGATYETKELLKREGIDVSGHRSQKITRAMVRRSDLILVMEKLHEERVIEMYPEAKNRLFLLKEFAKINGNTLDIADPIGKPIEFYGHIFNIVKNAIERILEII